MSYHSFATLPQELIDLIVEQLGLDGDTKSLVACLTVSKAFFPMACACLWRDRFLGPYRSSCELGHVKCSTDNIPESPILRSLVRSMRLCVENWSFEDADKFCEDLIVVNALKRVNHVELIFHDLLERIPTSPQVIGKWHIVSLTLSYFGMAPRSHGNRDTVHDVANSCAFFENFPMLNHLELDHPVYVDGESTSTTKLCRAERHHKLPQPVSLTLSSVFYSGQVSSVVAGHLFSLKRLRTLESDYTAELDLLLTAAPDTVKELVIHTISKRGCPFLFHRAESILFSLDTKYSARDLLVLWTRIMAKNSSNNTVQRVTIEIQLHLEPERTAPKIRFLNLWTGFGTALAGLVALKELVIIYQPGRRDRIGNTDDTATRAGVTKFLRGQLGAIADPAHVRLSFIDRNV
ncbi:hypothetical protein BDZ89DRAFT_1062367 [Hymenopellis radicata]|nr:hypothetical protein BDZ89DRAFT_1062367 [Hymenopellis radicata]